MKVKLVMSVLLCWSTYGWAESNEVLLQRVVKLQSDLNGTLHRDQLLYDIGESVQKMDLSLVEYAQKSDYKNICHLKMVKSENFGDFVSYDGYHYRQLIQHYPQSTLADDASYRLIYVISTDTYNYHDTEVERNKLQLFVDKYPKSNFYKEAKERMNVLEDIAKSGGSTIVD